MDKNGEAGRTPVGAAITELILTIFRANARLLRAGDDLVRDFGITSARWQVLGAINVQPKTVAQIARDYELSRQGVLWIVQSMIKDGLLELIRNPDHRRAKLVRHTDHGKKVWNEVTLLQIRWSNALGENFNQDDVEKSISTLVDLCAYMAQDSATSDVD